MGWIEPWSLSDEVWEEVVVFFWRRDAISPRDLQGVGFERVPSGRWSGETLAGVGAVGSEVDVDYFEGVGVYYWEEVLSIKHYMRIRLIDRSRQEMR